MDEGALEAISADSEYRCDYTSEDHDLLHKSLLF